MEELRTLQLELGIDVMRMRMRSKIEMKPNPFGYLLLALGAFLLIWTRVISTTTCTTFSVKKVFQCSLPSMDGFGRNQKHATCRVELETGSLITLSWLVRVGDEVQKCESEPFGGMIWSAYEDTSQISQ